MQRVRSFIALAIIIAGCTAGARSMEKTSTVPAVMPSTDAAPTTANQTIKPRVQAEQLQTTTTSEAQPQKGRQRIVETQWQGVTVDLTSIEPASGEMLMVKFTYVNRGSDVAQFRMKDVYYVDIRNRRKYSPVGDGGVRVLASVDRGYRRVEIDPGRSASHWIKFPAPPAGVDRIDLYFPGALPMENVPIR